MSNSLADILASRSYDEPEEAIAIKGYVLTQFDKAVAVSIKEKEIVITAQSAAFANALRMQTRQLQQAAGTTKRLVFRIA